MKAFELNRLLQQAEQGGGPYLEFLRAPWLSMGIYRLPADGSDKQLPHTEDEVYYVLQGRGRFRAASEDREVQAGSIMFVPSGVEHRFHTIEEDLLLMVFFAPAEGSRAPSTAPA